MKKNCVFTYFMKLNNFMIKNKNLVFNIAVRLIIPYYNIPNWYIKYNFINCALSYAVVVGFVINVKLIKLVNSLSL